MMKQIFYSLLLLLLALGGEADRARAAFFNITLTPSTISFPDQDPDAVPVLQANTDVVIALEVRGNPFADWTLTARSRGDLTTGGSTIPISSVSWQAVKTSGDPDVTFYNGNLTSAISGTTVATGTGKESSAAGILTFYLQNLWSYDAGNYTQTTDFILSSP